MAGLVLWFLTWTIPLRGIDFCQKRFPGGRQVPGRNRPDPAAAAMEFMERRLQKGREGVFDDLLREYGIFSKRLVRKCLAVYRGHRPRSPRRPMPGGAWRVSAHYPKYIVTDGNKLVQANKIKA